VLKRRFALVAVAGLLGLAGCSGGESSGSGEGEIVEVEASDDPCTKANLPTMEPGILTIGTDTPAYEPWFKNDDPGNGQGFESAAAYTIADRLGYNSDEVKWVVASFNSLIQPGEKPFDFAINQVSITDERKEAVDFSPGYYDVNQALITIAGSPIEGATTIEELQGAKLGAAVGTTSYTTIVEGIAPTNEPAVFDNNDVAKQALANGQIDGLVVDLPTAFYITAAELDNGVIVGQFPTKDATEQFGLVLDKGSALTDCVSAVVEDLRADGTLDGVQQQWLADVAGAPVLLREGEEGETGLLLDLDE
jgi:polar amino acid transport system substrate-binding protein